ncbi:Fe-S protein assembly co-chaperone HscB [Candidatus Profftia tarda]|nr:Fe-S protein assembly co-chaperone HscB [Candidatus Profftia tarda]
MNYFTLFGLPVCYLLDGNLLASRYKALQRKFHPDRHTNNHAYEHMQAIAYAATINNAYQTLKSPLKRAQYILSLQGLDLENTDHTACHASFLFKYLKFHEELDAIVHLPDSEKEMINFKGRIYKMIKKRNAQMTFELEQKQWKSALKTLCELRFLDKIEEQINQIEEKNLGL